MQDNSEDEDVDQKMAKQKKNSRLISDKQWRIIVGVFGSGLAMVLVFLTLM
eukprot:CAMPEP_0116872532 /NCGR_PEP_ID=MMETSP0463-20121206/3303_1 /TAXON_ID=181622 /ORGANISM="Strombidinopsis sp, Strain SopsisLIS2011" /LENGTH=50 /DNA_ID=CAMNT_0004512889 /DNA_START=110 /DNA_END=259 /DNA_ORIENTATION=+